MNLDPVPLAQRLEGRLARLLSHVPGEWLLRLIGERPRVADGLTMDPHVQFILATRRKKPANLIGGAPPEHARRRNRREIRAANTSAGATPTAVGTVTELQIPTGDTPLRARHYAPFVASNTGAAPLLVFFHGGGFVICDLDTHDETCRMLCAYAGFHVLSVAYRLAPEHPFPAGLDDCTSALRWAMRHARELGADATRVCSGGDSAGGNLAIGAALTMAAEGLRVAAQLLIYPETDATTDTASRRLFHDGPILTADDIVACEHYYIGTDTALRADPRMSPALSPALSLSPSTYLVTAGFDPLRDEGEKYVRLLQDAGVRAELRREPGLVHGFLHMTRVVPAAHAAVVDMARRFRILLDGA
jgi:acetyl esterase